MHNYMNTKKSKIIDGFTIVELIVVISIVGLLAGIVAVGYSGWQKSSITSQLKSDLNGVASAMENARTFNNAYPITSIPSTFKPSSNVTLVAANNSSDSGKTYCIDATSSRDGATIKYYIDSNSGNLGAQSGTCALRTAVPGTAPIPANFTATAVAKDTINLAWTVVTGASYTVQRSSNSAFTDASTIATPVAGTITLVSSGLTPGTEYYYRISSTLSGATSDWSLVASATTTSSCADISKYGTPPDCYAYDALPIAASIEGYWTNAPDGYLPEDGSAISRIKYADLFAAIGTTFGSGNGITTFNVPDSRGRTTVNQKNTDVEFATIGQETGSKTEALTINQIPNHNHLQYLGQIDDKNFTGYQSGSQYPPSDGPGQITNTQFTGYTGDGLSHNNIQPSIVKMSAIKYRPATGSASTLPILSSISGYWINVPAGYLYEDGSAVSRSTYATLYTALGGATSPHGQGDGSTTFNLPDSRGLATVNISPTDTEYDSMYDKTGSKTEILTLPQIPSHTHSQYLGSIDNLDWSGYFYSGLQYPPGDGPGQFGPGQITSSIGGGLAHNNIQPSITKMTVIKTSDAFGSYATPILTSINGYWLTAPYGYCLEDGSAKNKTLYPDLYEALGGTSSPYGQDATTFNLPDSRGRISVNWSKGDAEFDSIGEKIGEKTHTLTIGELPRHRHTEYMGQVDDQNFTGYATASQYPPSDGSIIQETTSLIFGYTGGGGSHNELQPTVAKRYAIKCLP